MQLKFGDDEAGVCLALCLAHGLHGSYILPVSLHSNDIVGEMTVLIVMMYP